MNYDDKIRELEVQLEGVKTKIQSSSAAGQDISALEFRKTAITEMLSNYRMLHHESQFDNIDDRYDY